MSLRTPTTADRLPRMLGFVLFGYTDLMRVAGLPKNVWEMDDAEIKDLDAGSWFSVEFADERIPILEQAIGLTRDSIRLYIELKHNGYVLRRGPSATGASLQR